MRRKVYVLGGGAAGLAVGLIVYLVVYQASDAMCLGDPMGGEPTLSGVLGLLGLWASVVTGIVLGYRMGAPGPDIRTIEGSQNYYSLLRERRDLWEAPESAPESERDALKPGEPGPDIHGQGAEEASK